jgi:hypothetical protein
MYKQKLIAAQLLNYFRQPPPWQCLVLGSFYFFLASNSFFLNSKILFIKSKGKGLPSGS